MSASSGTSSQRRSRIKLPRRWASGSSRCGNGSASTTNGRYAQQLNEWSPVHRPHTLERCPAHGDPRYQAAALLPLDARLVAEDAVEGLGLPADEVFMDLEDSVAPGAKEERALEHHPGAEEGDWTGKTTVVRANGVYTKWCADDVARSSRQRGPDRLHLCRRRLKAPPVEIWTLFRSEAQLPANARVDPATRGGRGVRSAGLG